MPYSNRGPLIGGAIVGTMLVCAIVAPIALAYQLQRLGFNPWWMFTAPHEGYVAARNRHDVEWKGIRIRVGPKYVIEPDGEFIRVGRIKGGPLFFEPAISFRPSKDSSAMKFERSRERCRVSVDPKVECTIHDGMGPKGNVVCIERRSHRHPEEFDLWQCKGAGAPDAVFFGTPAQCAEEAQIVLDAFGREEAERQ